MPTYEAVVRFLRDYEDLSAAQRRAVRRALARFIEDVEAGRFRPGLRVKALHGMPGHYEMTWAPDGRAIFRYGPEVLPGVPHVVWVAIGGHDILP